MFKEVNDVGERGAACAGCAGGLGLKVDISIVDGDEDTLVPEAGLNGVSSGQIGGGPVRSGNQERVGSRVVIRGNGVGGGGVGWR